MSYTVLRTDTFNDQLQNAILYIADDSGSIDIALDYLGKIEEAILQLKDFPESGSYPRYAALKRRGFRVLIIKRHIVFYKVNQQKNQVILYAFVDSRQEYRNLI